MAKTQQSLVIPHYGGINREMPISSHKQLIEAMKNKSPATKAGEEAIERLKRWPGEHKVIVGLSGGVDSSLTAALLVEAGWDVEGMTLWLMSGKGTCCSEGLIDAAGICEQLGINHHVVDSRSNFQKEIVQKLITGYKEGITPLPCSQCNRSVKFTPMLEWAKQERKINRIATGHYARIRHPDENCLSISSIPGESHGRYKLLRGSDLRKDQSYFLYDLPQEVLSNVVFPLGELTKPNTRKEAERYGLRTAQKAESQDLCLADHYGSMKAFLDNFIEPRRGEIVLRDGTIVGEHDGIEHFTIGQRKGLGVSWSEPLHVIKIDSAINQITVATRDEAGKSMCTVGAVNWISINPPKGPVNIEVQVRYRSKTCSAKLTPINPEKSDLKSNRPYRCQLSFNEKQFSITPGQAAVFYSDETVLGGGLIQS